MPQEKILIVEDEIIVALDIKRTLENCGFLVSGIAASGEEAQKMIIEETPDLVLMDIMLRNAMDGIEAGGRIRKQRDIPIVLLTSCTDEGTLRRARSHNLTDIITKPFTQSELSIVLRTILQKHRLIMDLRRLSRDSPEASKKKIFALGKSLEKKDTYTAWHQKRVASLARAIARDLELSRRYQKIIEVVAQVHDLGKIIIPSEILDKPGRLSETEFALVKSHARFGCDLLHHVQSSWPIAEIVSQHHERLDGSGYPYGYKQSEVYLGSRIIAVADVVEAMSSPRPYRPAHSLHQTLKEISNNRGVLYDTHVVDSCLRLFKKNGFAFR